MGINKTFQALSDKTRQKILELLKKKDMTAGQLNKHFNITAPSLSHHLSILKNANLVDFRKEGQERIYFLNLSVFEEMSEKIIKFFKI